MKSSQIHLVILGVLATGECFSFDYILDPRITASQRYDNNITLQLPGNQQQNWISTLSPGLDFGFRQENSEFKSNFTWNHLFYNNQSELDIDEQLVNIDFKHWGEKIDWGLAASYNNRSSLNTDTQTGRLSQQVRRKDIEIAPSISYKFDDRNSLSLDYSYFDTRFQQNSVSFLNNYSYHSITTGFNHLFTRKDRLSLVYSASIYDSPGAVLSVNQRVSPSLIPFNPLSGNLLLSQKIDQNTTSHTLQFGWQHSFSEDFVASLNAGARYTETEQITTTKQEGSLTNILNNEITSIQDKRVAKLKNSGFGQVFNASLQKSFERGSLTFNAYQQLTPTSVGNQQQTFLGVNGYYDLSERWRTAFDGSHISYELPSQQQSNQSRTYYSITPSISWKWTPEMNLQFSYTYRQLSFDNEDEVRQGNIAQILFTYQPLINRQVK